jgi:hypothetical protein
MKKQAWSKPRLIVLVRSKPEEAILAFCKAEFILAPGPGGYNGLCRNGDGAQCDTWADS